MSPSGGQVGGGGMGGVGGVAGSGSGGTVVADPNAVTAGNVCDRLSTIQCEAEERCCSAPIWAFDTCKTTMLQGCINELFLDSMSADPLTGFNAAQAQALFTEFDSLAQACDPSITAWGVSAAGFRSLLPGTLAPGANCTPINPLDNALVAASLASCASGATHACLPPQFTCDPLSPVGGPCTTDLNCGQGFFCNNPGYSGYEGMCEARRVVDSSCATGNECESLMCRGGLCVPESVDAAFCLQ